MGARAIAVVLIGAAVLADAAGAHDSALYLLLGAVPMVGVAALVALGDVIDAHELGGKIAASLQAFLSLLALLFALVAAASRSGTIGDSTMPAIGVSALLGCLIAFALQAAVALLADPHRHSQAQLQHRAGEDLPSSERLGFQR